MWRLQSEEGAFPPPKCQSSVTGVGLVVKFTDRWVMATQVAPSVPSKMLVPGSPPKFRWLEWNPTNWREFSTLWRVHPETHTHTHYDRWGTGPHFVGNPGRKETDQGSWGEKAMQSAFLWIRRDEARLRQHPSRDGEHLLSASYMSQRYPGKKWRGWCGEEMRLVGKHYSELGTISPPPAEPWDDIMTSEGLTLSEPESLIQVLLDSWLWSGTCF